MPLPRPLLRLLACLLALATSASLSATIGTFSVRDYGATGDGTTLDSPAINAAIEAAAAAGGGTVVLPAGDYLSYTIRLRSHITLHLGPGATLLAADPPAPGEPGGYDAPEPNEWNEYQDFGHSHWRNSLIYGEDLTDVSITGPGLIYGRGLSRGNGRISLPVNATPPPTDDGELPDVLKADGPFDYPPRPDLTPGPFNYPNARDALPAGVGNKAIALKNCTNVTLRDFRMLHGGHFAILATGVDNLTIDNLTIDTNRDGMDIDACSNVRISNTAVNAPWDDAICLKSSHGLGYARVCENVTITNCFVSGYDEGTLLDGTRTRTTQRFGGVMGRIKFGTEAGGGFRNITIDNCVFDYSRGLALEQVDGGVLEDVSISNITMRDVQNAPIFIRLGARLRSPVAAGPGTVRRINISNIVASNVAPDHGILIAGLPDHPIEDVTLSNLRFHYAGGGTAEQANREVPGYERAYPDPDVFGTMPSWGMFARHVANLRLHDIELRTDTPDARPAIHLEGANGASFRDVSLQPAEGEPTWVLRDVEDLQTLRTSGKPDNFTR
ncbi:rhamnogalacturonidase [Actomonas aquatica]|uniref:Glycosyl hydrolase family 28-related protein n=1 Tax=Actomonas aquatica TaxID=2866162 RepID=A0ABZ1C5B5_9BACT|nr:glycosyl hydrolase family 28-related protein [Opitutus sp. WL0086]WRQ86582.1 glycosyl hydrolase family 28-related protein [Opitutus sp. WL0086]